MTSAGTWRDNSYPGAPATYPSHVYSYSFLPNPEWSESFSSQPEIWAYLRDCAERGGLTPHLRYGHEVTGAPGTTRPSTGRSPRQPATSPPRVLISAGGPLSEPALPKLPGPGVLRRYHFPLGALEPRVRPGGHAGGRDRTGASGDPVRTTHPAGRRPAHRLPAHRAVDHGPPAAPDQPGRAAPVPSCPVRATLGTPGDLLGAGGDGAGFPASPGDEVRGSHVPQGVAPGGTRPGTACQADAQLHHGLQCGYSSAATTCPR